jgi:hypothetical protein
MGYRGGPVTGAVPCVQWRTERRRVRDLVPWEGNPRRITEKQAEDLRASLDRFGVADIPVVDADGTIVGGHQRAAILMAQGKGDMEVDVRVPSRKLTDEEFQELNLRLNKNLAEWDFDMLANFSEDLLLSVGFDETELMVGFGLSKAESSLIDPDRYCVLTVEPPEAVRLKARMSFHCDTREEFDEIKRAFGREGDQDNELDKARFLEVVREVLARA